MKIVAKGLCDLQWGKLLLRNARRNSEANRGSSVSRDGARQIHMNKHCSRWWASNTPHISYSLIDRRRL